MNRCLQRLSNWDVGDVVAILIVMIGLVPFATAGLWL